MKQYKVRKSFQYNNKLYVPGDLWSPQGGKFDYQIIEQGVMVDSRPVPDKKVIRKLGADVYQLLQDAGFTPDAAKKADDKELLAIKGIGPKKLKIIREVY